MPNVSLSADHRSISDPRFKLLIRVTPFSGKPITVDSDIFAEAKPRPHRQVAAMLLYIVTGCTDASVHYHVVPQRGIIIHVMQCGKVQPCIHQPGITMGGNDIG